MIHGGRFAVALNSSMYLRVYRSGSANLGGVFLVLEKIKDKRSEAQARKKRREEEGEERGEEEEGRRDFTEPLAACARLGMLRINRNVHFCGL